VQEEKLLFFREREI